MNVCKMKKEDFDKVPKRSYFSDKIEPFFSLVIIPQEEMHDSGYRCMDFVAIDSQGEPIVRLSGSSDVLEIDGIGGLGNWRGRTNIPTQRPIQGWKIDCLPCGLLRLFCRGKIVAGAALSSFEIFWEPVDSQKED